jgi:hypothetical protein
MLEIESPQKREVNSLDPRRADHMDFFRRTGRDPPPCAGWSCCSSIVACVIVGLGRTAATLTTRHARRRTADRRLVVPAVPDSHAKFVRRAQRHRMLEPDQDEPAQRRWQSWRSLSAVSACRRHRTRCAATLNMVEVACLGRTSAGVKTDVNPASTLSPRATTRPMRRLR